MPRLRIVVTVLLALALVGAAWLQVEKPRGALPANFKKLGLRDDQRDAILKISGEYKAKFDDLKKKLAKLADEREAAYEAVLTPEQLKRLKEIRSKERSKEPEKDKAKEKDK
jgi:hypothetical protein